MLGFWALLLAVGIVFLAIGQDSSVATALRWSIGLVLVMTSCIFFGRATV